MSLKLCQYDNSDKYETDNLNLLKFSFSFWKIGVNQLKISSPSKKELLKFFAIFLETKIKGSIFLSSLGNKE